jgi:dihydropteroate synthase
MTTQIVGILNLTPDSFSDGGKADSIEKAAVQMIQIFEDGAAIVDVGAESTRPRATPIDAAQEWARLEPFLQFTRDHHPAFLSRISIDTRHAQTAKYALEYGVCWINDVNGLQSPQMVDAVKHSNCDLVVMHSLTIPADPDVTLPDDSDVVFILKEWALSRLQELSGQGIARARIILDPGIGFGKTAKQSLEIIRRAEEFNSLHTRIMFGHSRKSFLGLYSDALAKDRDTLTAQFSAQLTKSGVSYLRVHNVKTNVDAIRLL